MIQITCKGNSAICTRTERLTSGMVGLQCEFVFDGAWDGLAKMAVFTAGNEKRDVLLTGTICDVPPEVMRKPGYQLVIGVYGTNADGTLVIPTCYAMCGGIGPGADPSGDESTDPTLPVWGQMQGMIGDLSQLQTSAKSNKVDAINEAAQSGVSTTEKNLLLSLFQNAAYTADMSATIAQLETLWSGSDEPVEPHVHSYTSSVTTAATCTTAGVRTYTCSCGDSYTEEIPTTGHVYEAGVCTVCGEADPNYVAPENNGWEHGVAYTAEWTNGLIFDRSDTSTENTGFDYVVLPCAGVNRLSFTNTYTNYGSILYDADQTLIACTQTYMWDLNMPAIPPAAKYIKVQRRADAASTVIPYCDPVLDENTVWESGAYYQLDMGVGGMNTSTGAESESTTAVRSNFAFCYGATSLQTSQVYRSFFLFYDAEKNFLSTVIRQTNGGADPMTVPEGAYYFRYHNGSGENNGNDNPWVILT